jgi:hypothetical protein
MELRDWDAYTRFGSVGPYCPPSSGGNIEHDASRGAVMGGPASVMALGGAGGVHVPEAVERSGPDLLGYFGGAAAGDPIPPSYGAEAWLRGHAARYASLGATLPPDPTVVASVARAGAHGQSPRGVLPPLHPEAHHRQEGLVVRSSSPSQQQFSAAGRSLVDTASRWAGKLTAQAASSDSSKATTKKEATSTASEHDTATTTEMTTTPTTTRAGQRSPTLLARGASTDSEATANNFMMRGGNLGPVVVQEKQKRASTSSPTSRDANKRRSVDVVAREIPRASFDAQARDHEGTAEAATDAGRSLTTSPSSSNEKQGGFPTTKRRLPPAFAPSPDTVVLGKGNGPKVNTGNLRLKGLVVENLDDYVRGERREKIAIISNLIRHVRRANANSCAGFVKYEDGHWWEATERDARVKVTALFRDCLHDKYRSSSTNKVKRRQLLREQTNNEHGNNNK